MSVKAAGSQDDCYRKLMETIEKGFPEVKIHVDEDLREYWDWRNDLSVENGVVMLGQRIVIPRILRRQILEQLHAAHQGQVRTLRRARQVVFWPGLTNDVRNVVVGCEICAKIIPSQQREPMMTDPSPTRPFESVAADIFAHAGTDYLVVTDISFLVGLPCIGWAKIEVQVMSSSVFVML